MSVKKAALDERPQQTLAGESELTGIGIHTGQSVRLRMLPAQPDTGLRFRRVDLPGQPEIPAMLDNVMDDLLDRRTTIGLDKSRSVSTVEHLLAGCVALGLDNAIFELDGPEMPFMDGSALPLAQAIQTCGLVNQDCPCRFFELKRPIVFDRYPVQMAAFPSPNLRISYFVEYDNKVISNQARHFKVTPKRFLRSIAPARTFCFLSDVEALQKRGLIQGGSLECAVVIGEDRILNENLRFSDEIIRHKVVDLLGDLALLGRPLRAHVTAWRAGHSWHLEFLKQMKEELLQ